MKEGVKEPYQLTRWLFIRGMAIVYGIAFISLAKQVLGLIGSDGILPAQEYLTSIHTHYGKQAYAMIPSLFWLNASDGMLVGVCWTGVFLSVLLFVGIAPAFVALALWFVYLSFLYIGQVFLSFQWDILLLEAGFLTIFFCPWQFSWKVAQNERVSRSILWLLRLLLFKLMFLSGVVKIMSQDPVWRDMSALTYHYWTQPLPNPLSWYVHQMPLWFHKLSCMMMFFVELIVPFFIFCGRWGRLSAFVLLSGLQVILFTTGNYTFFSALSIVLCVPLLDDAILRRCLRLKSEVITFMPVSSKPEWKVTFWLKRVAVIGVTALILFLYAEIFLLRFLPQVKVPQFVTDLSKKVDSYAICNRYGLFANMTTLRREIIIEGSNDKIDWKEYKLPFKPSDIHERPKQVAPHQPRLDWQMWFAALSHYKRNMWLVACLRKLLEGSQSVEALFAEVPFDKPPRYIRARFYDYTFTTAHEYKESGAYWKRSELGLYIPVLMLQNPVEKRPF